jgi:uncharacterized membrane protein YdjX (TVP38/TMEM64 family)
MSAVRAARVFVLLLLISAIVVTVALLLTTEQGRRLMREPHAIGADFRAWVRAHSPVAPVVFVALYVTMALLMIPLWWLQVLAGYGFGLIAGVMWCQLGATIAAPAAAGISRWLAGEWFARHVESKLPRLRAVEEKLGHNGLLVVIAARVLHGMPFGLINYAFGLMHVPLIDAAVGTLIGGVATVTVYVAIGTDPALLANWRFIAIIVLIHAVILVPLVLRYLQPAWFRRIGIE